MILCRVKLSLDSIFLTMFYDNNRSLNYVIHYVNTNLITNKLQHLVVSENNLLSLKKIVNKYVRLYLWHQISV